jgi:hypothetical protein
MRTDVYIENDSGGLSVISGAAVQDIIEDQRRDDDKFVTSYRALLLMLYGDDSVPVRVVVDEPLTEDERAQWLACTRWKIDAPDGRVLVAGGFDPDVLQSWLEKEGPDESGWGVSVIHVPKGTWRADLYAHVGSLNGRHLVSEAPLKPGAWFRRDHPGVPFPLWLSEILSYTGEDDPGHEEIWGKPDDNIRSGALAVDLAQRSFVGFLLHLHRDESAPLSPVPEGGWFDLETGARVPKRFPRGLPAAVEDPDLASAARRILQEQEPEAEPPPSAKEPMSVHDAWDGDPLAPLEEGTAEEDLKLVIHVYLLGLLASEGAPEVELRVRDAGGWKPPSPQHDFVAVEHEGGYRAGPPANFGGWAMLSAMITTGLVLSELPDAAHVELAMLNLNDNETPDVGRFWFSGIAEGGRWRITHASPRTDASTLADALAYTRDLFYDDRIVVRGDEERAVMMKTLEELSFMIEEKRPPTWKGDTLSLAGYGEKDRCMWGRPIFRHRYGKAWPMPPLDED